MSHRIDRRTLIAGTAGALGIAFVGVSSVGPFTSEARWLPPATRPPSARPSPTRPPSTPPPPTGEVGYGPLRRRKGRVLALPDGFDVTIVARSGHRAGGLVHPSDPDAIGRFAGPGGSSILVVNHEIKGQEPHRVPLVDGCTYDPGARGGTTTLHVGADNTNLEQYVSLSGTHNNCAGGVTPWSTWLTCEETEVRATGPRQHDHGYVFEVNPDSHAANRGVSAIPLRFLGRFPHEACAVDPRTSTIYLTEDARSPNGLYYRWLPPAGFSGGRGALHALATSDGGANAGRLQAMRCTQPATGEHVPDLSLATRTHTRYDVSWVDVPDRLAREVSVRKQLSDDQVTRSRKLEGQWWGGNGPYFVASYARRSDGSAHAHDGQVWFYDPYTQQITLTALFGVPARTDSPLDGPDNLTVSPYGGLILAEDGRGRPHLVGVTEQGSTYPLARCELPGDNEFCGPVFNAAGDTLFVNLQGPDYTLAITGPWGRPSNGNPNSSGNNGTK